MSKHGFDFPLGRAPYDAGVELSLIPGLISSLILEGTISGWRRKRADARSGRGYRLRPAPRTGSCEGAVLRPRGFAQQLNTGGRFLMVGCGVLLRLRSWRRHSIYCRARVGCLEEPAKSRQLARMFGDAIDPNADHNHSCEREHFQTQTELLEPFPCQASECHGEIDQKERATTQVLKLRRFHAGDSG